MTYITRFNAAKSYSFFILIQVTLKGVMNQKMPYFAYCNDAQHLVCLSRNRMYVNLMNLESGDCITTFKAGEDRFLNSLLVSGDGRYDTQYTQKFSI